MDKGLKVGAVIRYRALGGGVRTVTVSKVYEDVKNGRPGFDAVLADGSLVWGYTADVMEVVR